jgi:hypothetical protein
VTAVRKLPRPTCRTCGEPLVAASTGRPPAYCSVPCRKAAEYALRRSQGLLKRAEMRAQDAALAVHLAGEWQRGSVKKRLEFWQAEVERLQVALRELLAGTDER